MSNEFKTWLMPPDRVTVYETCRLLLLMAAETGRSTLDILKEQLGGVGPEHMNDIGLAVVKSLPNFVGAVPT